MFSLLATVVTFLVLGSAMLWRGVSALSRSRSRPRALGRRRSRRGPRMFEGGAMERGPLQGAQSADAPVARTGLPHRW